VSGPAVTYELVDDEAGMALDGLDGTSTANVNLAAWAMLDSDCLAIGRVFRKEWNGFQGSIGTVRIDWSIFDSRTLDYVADPAASDQGYYVMTMTFRLAYQMGA